jgi:hypothetical protein
MDGCQKAKLVYAEDYLCALSRYVHLDPVRTARWRRRPIQDQVKHLRRIETDLRKRRDTARAPG